MAMQNTLHSLPTLTPLHSLADCRAFRQDHLTQTLVLVPTMGALHEGHQALIQHAKKHGDVVVVSLFVNPTQFAPHEDFEAYPRPLADDLNMCEALGVDAVFLPTANVMYPNGFESEAQEALYTQVLPPTVIEKQLCGLSRPHFFTGVCSVVLRLFNAVQPDVAVFGEKDAQQLAIIRRMVSDLLLSVVIEPHPIVREPSGELAGLAMSSRNRYLTTEPEREAALVLSKTLFAIQHKITEASHEEGVSVFTDLDLLDVFHQELDALSPEARELVRLDYLSMVDDETFEPLTDYQANTRVLIAAFVGDVRLIDNVLVL